MADLALAPDEGIGVVVLTNTGALSGQGAAVPLGRAVLRQLLRLPDEALRADLAPHAEAWADLCGWYAPAPGPITNLFTRLLLGAGVEIVVHRNQLIMKPLTPLPAMRKGMRLHPDDPDDPYVFRVDMSNVGLDTLPVVFADAPSTGKRQLLMDVMAFDKRPDAQNPRRLATGALAAGAATLAVRRSLRHSHPAAGSPTRIEHPSN